MRLKQSRFTLMLLGVISVGALILVASALIWRHQVAGIAKLHAEYGVIDAEVKEITEKIKRLDEDKKKLADLKLRLAAIDQNLADYKYVPSYLRQMQVTAAKTGNIIRAIQPGELHPLVLQGSPFATGGPSAEQAKTPPPAANTQQDATGPQYLVQPINLEVEGSYVGLVKLLEEFRQFPKMIYVRSIDLTPRAQKGQSGVAARIQTFAIITPDQYQNTEVKGPGAAAGGRNE